MDYKALLIKYINYVGNVEGTDFISTCNLLYVTDVKFTNEEIEELQRLSEIAR